MLKYFLNKILRKYKLAELKMSLIYKGKEIKTDNEGYLLDEKDWSEDLMEFMAHEDGLSLTEEHITIIRAVKAYYEKYATTPAIRTLIRYLKTIGKEDLASSIKLAILFPDGAAKSASKYAGLKKPVKCI